jgi:hypothetical protein
VKQIEESSITKKEIKMNNKRTLVISAVAALVAVILTVAATRVFPSSAQNAGLIPVTGPSSSGVALVNENGQQNRAAYNSRVANTGESPEEEFVLSQQYHAANISSVVNTDESPEEEFVLSQQYHAADNNSVLNVPKIVSATTASQPALQVTGQYCPFNAQEIQSLHTVYNKDSNEPMLATSDGPIGYDGGTFALSQCRISK